MEKESTQDHAAYEYTRWINDKGLQWDGICYTRHGIIEIYVSNTLTPSQLQHMACTFVWKGRFYYLTRQRARIFTKLGAVRIAKRWVRGIVYKRSNK